MVAQGGLKKALALGLLLSPFRCLVSFEIRMRISDFETIKSMTHISPRHNHHLASYRHLKSYHGRLKFLEWAVDAYPAFSTSSPAYCARVNHFSVLLQPACNAFASISGMSWGSQWFLFFHGVAVCSAGSWKICRYCDACLNSQAGAFLRVKADR